MPSEVTDKVSFSSRIFKKITAFFHLFFLLELLLYTLDLLVLSSKPIIFTLSLNFGPGLKLFLLLDFPAQ